jgi:molybdopterin synthase catalytic subunit
MKLIGVVGREAADRRSLVERLVDRLGDRGAVGTVVRDDRDSTPDGGRVETAGHPVPSGVQSVTLSGDGWVATGTGGSLTDALDRLARACDYTVVEGFDGATIPTVALGDAADDDVLLRAARADEVDLDEAVAAIEARDHYETLESLVDRVKRSPDEQRADAIATFTGRVRAKDGPDDEPTEHLEFERYDDVAADRMAAIREELEAREGVYQVRLHHRTGVVEAGEDIVFVVVLAGHRPEAFRTVEDGIDRLKSEVPLFKKEVTVSDEFWADER